MTGDRRPERLPTAAHPRAPHLAAALLLGLLAALAGLSAAAWSPLPAAARPVPRLPSPASWPLAGVAPVLRGFDPPADRYSAGHRGVDLQGRVGEPVLAAAAGRVSFAGRIGGLQTVSIDHGQVRTTYTPVRAEVRVGERVDLGQPIGTLAAGHCPSLSGGRACLHWGLLRGPDDYLDPLLLVPPGSGGPYRYRLVAASERAAVLARQAAAARRGSDRRAAGSPQAVVAGGPIAAGTPAAARRAIAFAYAQLGKPYVFGATGPDTFDCSGLTMRAWEAGGVEIGHYTGVQWTNVQHISRGQLRAGDVVFWGSSADPASIYHTAIYVGGGKVIQAPRPGKSVELSGIGDWIAPNFFGRP